MCEFETPLFIYYSYISAIIVSLITGFLILLKDRKHPVNRNAFYFIMIIVLWIIGDLFQWTIHSKESNMFFAKISLFFTTIYLFFLYFSYHFSGQKINWKQKIKYALPLIPLILLIPTKYNIKIFNNECDYAHGIIIYYVYFLELLYTAWASCVLVKYYREAKGEYEIKAQIRVLVSAIWIFAILSIAYEEVGIISVLNNSFIEISPYFIVSNLFFISLIAFAIIKKDLFKFSETLLDWFTVFLWSLLFAGLFIFAESPAIIVTCAIAYAVLMVTFFRM